jgi:hypothetical protein
MAIDKLLGFLRGFCIVGAGDDLRRPRNVAGSVD